ncbi:hypothetical protein CTEN210_09834 [Chaetoceros tenuissimus]|uniref:Phosphoglycerate mutase n=1 Tax=Chaetoceros tenuissimus TaxID=426638 RepID=A0AAD3H7Z8_9STRA|nr:hypothetical protein CTEN210_09834 [Chaetoceros tenuissimus]
MNLKECSKRNEKNSLLLNETKANEAGIVLGQIDSPLTDQGIRQALAANDYYPNYGKKFWKIYASDLPRCKMTCSLIVNGVPYQDGKENHNCNDYHVIYEERLRERAKGCREGLSKKLSYEEAKQICIAKCKELNQEYVEPKHESEEDVLIRFKEWLNSVLHQASQLERNGNEGIDVLAVSHSGTIRIILQQIVGSLIPIDAEVNEWDGKLSVPNTSISILEFSTFNNSQSISVEGIHHVHGREVKVRMLDFTNTNHYKVMKEEPKL